MLSCSTLGSNCLVHVGQEVLTAPHAAEHDLLQLWSRLQAPHWVPSLPSHPVTLATMAILWLSLSMLPSAEQTVLLPSAWLLRSQGHHADCSLQDVPAGPLPTRWSTRPELACRDSPHALGIKGPIPAWTSYSWSCLRCRRASSRCFSL